ncbi:hypothetical protein ASPNIDRAFT_40432 [Aspergillus niger ATCC 1015]|uniref:Uncharacterized protein n=1 Tax=Aspergillus niger (strain ATCC 1015 / CBS 113.46 / FGSC A1144 / LSHB Ac4 / NCTC 3858a / NRRL 328 / USDA 3528.7) TaxID=380704 RepID=G3XXQ6_ASPNA|nr:hypothetical protein ASPNIDRAFT_40432 [Aspergillus niger ATCC 1015]
MTNGFNCHYLVRDAGGVGAPRKQDSGVDLGQQQRTIVASNVNDAHLTSKTGEKYPKQSKSCPRSRECRVKEEVPGLSSAEEHRQTHADDVSVLAAVEDPRLSHAVAIN